MTIVIIPVHSKNQDHLLLTGINNSLDDSPIVRRNITVGVIIEIGDSL